MLREYELTIITRAELLDAEKAKTLEGYESIIKRNGGDILEKRDSGVKKLSYPIKKSSRGHYIYYDIATLPENIAECERLMRIDENVLRHLIVKTDDTVNIEERKNELLKSFSVSQESLDKRVMS
ncbi:MAG: 30S ribosomal protein S6 [Oligoflexales bacterium]|nr:30S ribosomal protein S6 [Oligoflexales bacterium]